jgi:hypothetical protein
MLLLIFIIKLSLLLRFYCSKDEICAIVVNPMIKQDHIVLNEHGVTTQDNSATISAIMALALIINLICLMIGNLF